MVKDKRVIEMLERYYFIFSEKPDTRSEGHACRAILENHIVEPQEMDICIEHQNTEEQLLFFLDYYSENMNTDQRQTCVNKIKEIGAE